MTFERVRDLLAELEYKDWRFEISREPFAIRARFVDGGEAWSTRKWLLSQHMTEGEVIQTALSLVLMAEEHEAREKFLFRGAAIFGPHMDIDALIRAARNPVVRAPSPRIVQALAATE